jgi:hypothetical protein
MASIGFISCRNGESPSLQICSDKRLLLVPSGWRLPLSANRSLNQTSSVLGSIPRSTTRLTEFERPWPPGLLAPTGCV